LDRYRVPCSPDSPCLACPDQVEDEAFREAEYLVKLVPTVVPYSNPSDTLGDSLDVLIPLDGTPPPATISPDYQHLACNLDYFFLLPKRDSDSWHMPLRLCPQSTIAVLLEAQKLPQYDPTLYASYRSPIVYATLGSAVAHTEKEEKKAQALPSEDDLHLSLGPSQEATQEGSYGEVDPVATQDPGIQLSFAQATQDDNQGNGFRPPTMKGTTVILLVQTRWRHNTHSPKQNQFRFRLCQH
jgi:hypothetical protein